MLPFSLQHPIDAARSSMTEDNHQRTMNLMLDFFEIAGMYLSVVLLAKLRSLTPMPEKVREVVRFIDRKRPLSFGDWVNEILGKLTIVASASLPDDPVVQSLSRIISRKRNLFLGSKHSASLVQIRNEYKGHGMIRADEIYEKLVQQLLPRFEELVEAIAPLDGFDTRSLYPLVFVDESGAEYVFQTLSGDEAMYVSADEHAERFVGSSRNRDIDQWLQQIEPSFDVSRERNWIEYRELINTTSAEYLSRIYAQRKYNRELYVVREDSERVHALFHQSGKTLFPMLGEAGQGKTNQICHWVETLTKRGEAVMAYACSEFTGDSLEQMFRRLFSLSPRKPIETLLHHMDGRAAAEDRYIYIYFDAINECIQYPGDASEPGPLRLFRDIHRLFANSEHSRFRILLTCRNYTWQQQIQPELKQMGTSLIFGLDNEDYNLHGFTDREVENAYRIYSNLYQMETPFQDLPRTIVLRLKDPLILRIAANNYLGREMATDSDSYTSLQLFEDFTHVIEHSYAGRNQKQIIRLMGQYLLGRILAGDTCDAVSIDAIRSATGDGTDELHQLHRLIYTEDGLTAAAQELKKQERSILRVNDRNEIQFVYERYLEYILALSYRSHYQDQELTPEAVRADLHRGERSEVFRSALRNVLLMLYAESGDSGLILDLVKRFGNDFATLSLVHDTMSIMVGELYEDRLFDLLSRMLSEEGENAAEVAEYNQLVTLMLRGRATTDDMARYGQLSARLQSSIQIKNLAGQVFLNGLLLTDYHNENLFHHDPMKLIEMMMSVSINEVRDQMCMYVYYLSVKTHTSGFVPLRENLTVQLIRFMHDEICQTPLFKLLFISKKRRHTLISYLETGVRLDVLLIIDRLLSQDRTRRAEVEGLYHDIVRVFSHLTLDFTLIRLILPWLSQILTKQFTFQSDYCNNLTEYSDLWSGRYVSPVESHDRWSRQDVARLAPYLLTYSKYVGEQATLPRDAMPSIDDVWDKVHQAYMSGDALSYFMLERVLVVNAMTQPEEMFQKIFSLMDMLIEKDSEWKDYSAMSLIYVLYQMGMKLDEVTEEHIAEMGRRCVGWTRHTRGYFQGHKSKVANANGLYKRNVMAWYTMVWCRRYNDLMPEAGVPDITSPSRVPYMDDLIDEAIRNHDKELLMHLIYSVSELITDAKFIHVPLLLLKHIMTQLPDEAAIAQFEQGANMRYKETRENIVEVIGRVLGIAALYYPNETKRFLRKDVLLLTFPGLHVYSERLLDMNPAGEKLSDLFTHKFGNFIIHSLICEPAIGQVVVDALTEVPNYQDAYKWAAKAVRVSISAMFKIKV